MNTELIEMINQWSIDRGLNNSDPAKQLIKLQEEVNELKEAHMDKMYSNINSGVPDSIGDILVVLTIFCQQIGLDINYCLKLAVDTIKDRKGKTINGVFVKDE